MEINKVKAKNSSFLLLLLFNILLLIKIFPNQKLLKKVFNIILHSHNVEPTNKGRNLNLAGEDKNC